MPAEVTEALLLRTTPYGERGAVLQVLTPSLGYTSFLAQALEGRSAGLLHPLALLRVEFHPARRAGNLAYVRNLERIATPRGLTEDLVRSAIASLIASLLPPLTRDNAPGESLYTFVRAQAERLDDPQTPIHVFPQTFVLLLARELGIPPQGEFGPGTPCFSLPEGRFVMAGRSLTPGLLPEEDSQALDAILRGGYHTPPDLIPKAQRGPLLEHLINYLQIHTQTPLPKQNLAILQAIWR